MKNTFHGILVRKMAFFQELLVFMHGLLPFSFAELKIMLLLNKIDIFSCTISSSTTSQFYLEQRHILPPLKRNYSSSELPSPIEAAAL